jgi:uncharacterized protein (TIGR00730 family)
MMRAPILDVRIIDDGIIMKRLAVYCGSATPADPAYIDSARSVGRALAELGIGVVYGGGKLGLMGAVADAALAAGGEVIGVIPEALMAFEVAHLGLTALHVVANMHERKAMMTDLCDGFITLPGGVGTMDELWEAVSWAQLGYHAKPVGLLNVGGFYDDLIAFNRTMAKIGFVRPHHQTILLIAETLPDLLDQFSAHTPPVSIVQMKREDL